MWTSTPAGCLIGDNCNSDVGGEPDALKGASPVRRGAEGRSQRDATRPTLRIEAKYPAPLPVITATNPDQRDAELDTLFARVPVTLKHFGSQPYYQPSGDHVVMPQFADFHTSDDYYSTLAHELCHATGHVDRLARPSLISTKREDYAREELVAELGAAFVSATIGIKLHDREDHAAYLANWLQALRNDKKCIFTAARLAQDASDWLLSRMAVETAPELEAAA